MAHASTLARPLDEHDASPPPAEQELHETDLEPVLELVLDAEEEDEQEPEEEQEDLEPPTLRLSVTGLSSESVEEPPTSGSSSVPWKADSMAPVPLAAEPGTEWRDANTVHVPARSEPSMEWLSENTKPFPVDNAIEADKALGINALRDAISRAALALAFPKVNDDTRGRMWLVQAIAFCWLGEYEPASSAAYHAMDLLPRGSTGWHAALGHLVIASGQLGRKAVLLHLATEDLKMLEKQGPVNPAYLVSYCRLAVHLAHVGWLEMARDHLENARRHMGRPEEMGPFACAWLETARAEIALHGGELMEYAQRSLSAVELFTSASDVRNACLLRGYVGNALMQLGAYEQTLAVLRECISIAEPMQLYLVAAAKANLGHSLACLGRIEEGMAAAKAAREQFSKQGNPRGEAGSLVYLSRMYLETGNVETAFEAAGEAAALADGVGAVRAVALAVQAQIELKQNRPSRAISLSTQAAALLDGLRDVEEGESLIQVVHALALRGVGREAEGMHRIREARARLLAKAVRIDDPRWRRCFLENVSDNARLLGIAEQWVGE